MRDTVQVMKLTRRVNEDVSSHLQVKRIARGPARKVFSNIMLIAKGNLIGCFLSPLEARSLLESGGSVGDRNI